MKGCFMKNLVLVFLAIILCNTPVFASDKPSLAVLDFTNNVNAYWWKPGVGRDLANMLSNELASSKKFRMLERKKISSVIGELDFNESKYVDKSTKRKIGKLKGAQYLVTASVTSFEENTEGSNSNFNFMGFGVGQKSQKASLSVDLRVIETETGEIVDTRTIEATSESSSNGFSGRFMGVGGSTSESKKTPATKAIRGAVVRIADYLVCSMVDKTPECLAEFGGAEDRRRAKTRESIKLDE
jgi:curli biogenesis system outer membrane secretion channel CsgG